MDSAFICLLGHTAAKTCFQLLRGKWCQQKIPLCWVLWCNNTVKNKQRQRRFERSVVPFSHLIWYANLFLSPMEIGTTKEMEVIAFWPWEPHEMSKESQRVRTSSNSINFLWKPKINVIILSCRPWTRFLLLEIPSQFFNALDI